MRVERELMRGAGPAAVLRLLEGGERYGYELVKLLDRSSDGVLAMGQSTLYPLLYNLEAKALIASRVAPAFWGRQLDDHIAQAIPNYGFTVDCDRYVRQLYYSSRVVSAVRSS